jgi:hypothetical protein
MDRLLVQCASVEIEASGYLSRLRTCKITRPCQAATNGDPVASMEVLGFAEGSKPTVTAYGRDVIIARPQPAGSVMQDRIPMSAFAEMMSELKKYLHTLH